MRKEAQSVTHTRKCDDVVKVLLFQFKNAKGTVICVELRTIVQKIQQEAKDMAVKNVHLLSKYKNCLLYTSRCV